MSPFTCPALEALAGTQKDAAPALQACLDAAPPGMRLHLHITPGTYYLSTPVHIVNFVALTPVGVTAALPACNGQNPDICVAFIVDMFDFANSSAYVAGTMPIIIGADHVYIDHFLFSGVRGQNVFNDKALCANHATLPMGGGIHLDGNYFMMTKSMLTNFSCYTSFEAGKTTGLRIIENYFTSNGSHLGYGQIQDRTGSFSDGLTIHDAVDAHITSNAFGDNTDVQLIFGGCQNCTVQYNSFRHTTAAGGGSFADLMIQSWEGKGANGKWAQETSGNFTGTIFSDNNIDCGPLKNCGFGIMVGASPWYGATTVNGTALTFGGTVQDNSVKNAMVGILVDNVTGPVAFHRNTVANSGGHYMSSCGLRVAPSIDVAPPSAQYVSMAAMDADAQQYVSNGEFASCIFNHWMSETPMTGVDPRIVDAYNQILGRKPDATGIAGWGEALKNGQSMASIRQYMAFSLESTGYINNLYKDMLQRAPSSAELKGAQQLLAYGLSLDELRIIVGQNNDPNYTVGSSGITQTISDEVNDIYEQVLDRQPDPSGFTSWSDFLKGGATPVKLRTFIAQSPESLRNITLLYQELNQGQASPAEIQTAEQYLIDGGTLFELRSIIAQTPAAD